MARIAATKSPILDVLPRFGETANHSVLWLAVSLGLAATGNRRARRAALRGMAGVVIASTAANVLAKGLTGRARPVSDTPVLRRLVHAPKTTSFPSGHSASAAAFATGVALELPQLAVPVGAAAAAVGVSRVVTGVHYPSDVCRGFRHRGGGRSGNPALVAAAAGAARRGPGPGSRHPRRRQVRDSCWRSMQPQEALQRTWPGACAENFPTAEIIDVGEGEDIEILLRGAARRAQIIGVAGGDGTVNVAAGVAQEAGMPLLVIPAGTGNHFTADLGINSADDALAALAAGDAVQVDVGIAGKQSFLNTSSTGVYVDLVHARARLRAQNRQVARAHRRSRPRAAAQPPARCLRERPPQAALAALRG